MVLVLLRVGGESIGVDFDTGRITGLERVSTP